MYSRESQFVARAPRHQSANDAGLQVFALRPGEVPANARSFDLFDFSRQGVGLEMDEPQFADREHVTILMRHASSDFEFRHAAEVRWHRRQGDRWLVGFRFEGEVSWETLGEMFLNGLLSRERTPIR